MKKRIFILSIIFICFFPIVTKAASVSVSLSCPSSAKASTTVSCTIKATPSGADLKGIQSNIKITGGTYETLSLSSGWTAYSNSSSGFSLGLNSAKTTTVTVGTLKIKMPSSGNAVVSLTNVAGSDSSYATLNGNSPSSTIKVQSSVNTLSALSISGGTLSPTFNSSTLSYSATINDASVTISATSTDSNSKISGTGKKSLNYGKNTFSVVVTAEDGSKKTYTLNITRPDNRSTNNNLKSLSVDKGSISFSKDTTTYKVNVDENVTSIKISASIEDTKASFVSGNGPRTVNLNYGDNKILVKVKAENESIKTYTITVNRKDNRSSDSSLSSLNIEPEIIKFNSATTAYNATVAYEVETLKISYEVNDSKAKATIKGGEKLVVGNNEITITVTAENQSKTEYKINVTRQKEGERVLNNDSTLKSLKINGKEITLNESLTYTVELDKEDIAVINAITNQETSSVSLNNPDKLTSGSIISIKVTAEDGSETTYLVSCTLKVEEKSNTGLLIIVALITAVITELINVIIYKTVLSKRK